MHREPSNKSCKKKYPAVLQDTQREILLVGINYNKDAKAGNKKHSCKIVSLPAAHCL